VGVVPAPPFASPVASPWGGSSLPAEPGDCGTFFFFFGSLHGGPRMRRWPSSKKGNIHRKE
jgi:hypothetical protein